MHHCTADQLIAFERRMADLFEAGELPFLLHLSGGNEQQLIELFHEVRDGDWIFSGHRSHYHYLLAGGSEQRLEQLIRDGRSMFVFDRRLNFLTSSVLAGTCAIAAGVAWQLQESGSPNRVWCFLGDGAEDEGHFYEAVRFVDGHNLPCTFVIEDNSVSVDSDYFQRWGTHARHPWPVCVRRYRYERTWPHAGTGCKKMVTWDNPKAPVF